LTLGARGGKWCSAVVSDNGIVAERALTEVYEMSHTRNSLSVKCFATAKLSERFMRADKAS
jgi:hypothetical protein